MIMKAVKNYVLVIQGDSQGNVHIFGSYSVSAIVIRPFKWTCVNFLQLTEKKVFQYTDKNVLWMAELK
jgi:hypothetical protein